MSTDDPMSERLEFAAQIFSGPHRVPSAISAKSHLYDTFGTPVLGISKNSAKENLIPEVKVDRLHPAKPQERNFR
jgi:hypothetical protein